MPAPRTPRDERAQAAITGVKQVYADLAARPVERNCLRRTECCQFRHTGYTPWLTDAEAVVAVKAFRATLEEVVEASLILHVIDASAPGVTEHCEHVRAVLAEIGAEKTPQLLVLNKCDALAPEHGDRDSVMTRLKGEAGGVPAVWVSARTGEGLDDLLRVIDQTLPDDPVASVVFHFLPDEYARVSFLHEFAKVRSERYAEDGCYVEADAPLSVRRRLAAFEVQSKS